MILSQSLKTKNLSKVCIFTLAFMGYKRTLEKELLLFKFAKSIDNTV